MKININIFTFVSKLKTSVDGLFFCFISWFSSSFSSSSSSFVVVLMLVCGGGSGVVGVWGCGEGKKKKEWNHFRAFDKKLYSVCWNHTAQVRERGERGGGKRRRKGEKGRVVKKKKKKKKYLPFFL